MSKLIKDVLARALVNVPKKREQYPLVIMVGLLMVSGFFAFQTMATEVVGEPTEVVTTEIVESVEVVEAPVIVDEVKTEVPEGAQTAEQIPLLEDFLQTINVEEYQNEGKQSYVNAVNEKHGNNPQCGENQHMAKHWVDGYLDWWQRWHQGHWENDGCVDNMQSTPEPQCDFNEAYEGEWVQAEYSYECTEWDNRWMGHGNGGWQYVCITGEEVITGGYWEGECVSTALSCAEVTSQEGWYGRYYNYSRDHVDMNLSIFNWPDDGHGDPLGTWDTDWYNDNPYFRFERVDANLEFGGNFFPFDATSEEIDNGHDYHFGVHWRAQVTVDQPDKVFGENFTLTSDDDSWVYVDGVLIYENDGIHAPTTINGILPLDTDSHVVDIFFAERHTTQSHMSFSFDNPKGLTIIPMPEDCGVKVMASKVVCSDESYLPNWGEGDGPAMITATTASDFVAESHGACWLEEGWDFQWGINVLGIIGDHIGPAGDGWQSFDTSTNSSPASVTLYSADDTIKIRENLQAGYVPFSYTPDNDQSAPGNDYSAEIYCNDDVLNYDNYDYINNPELGETYYCVAFNAQKPGICGMKYNDLDQNQSYDGNDYPMSDWTITLQSKLQCEVGDEWADYVVSADQNGTVVAPERSLTGNALGIAEDNDTINFYSLGLGGELILGFNNLIENYSGDDIQVIETSFNNPTCGNYPEYVKVYASQDGNTWTDLGEPKCQAGDPTFDLGSLDWAQYIKLVDMSTNAGDGFDVDGVRALNCMNLSEPTSTVTTEDGGYCFTDLPIGQYQVCEVMQEGWANSTPLCRQVWFNPNQSETDKTATMSIPVVNFGNYSTSPEEDPIMAYELTKTLETTGDIHRGDVIEFNLRLENTGDFDIYNIDLLDEFDPAYLTFSNATSNPDGQTISALEWDDIDLLLAGDPWEIAVYFTVKNDAPLNIESDNMITSDISFSEVSKSILPEDQVAIVYFTVVGESYGGGGGVYSLGGGSTPLATPEPQPEPEVLGVQEFADCTEFGDYPAGTLIAQQGVVNATVYYIGMDCERYFFPDTKTYFTWYTDWSQVKKIDLVGLSAYANSGVAITYRPGTKFVTNVETPNVYAVEPQGKLRLIPSMEIGNTLFGANWLTKVQDVIVSFFSSSYTMGEDLSDTLPTGTLAKEEGNTTIYYIDNGTKRAFEAGAFAANGLWNSSVITADLSGYTDGTAITGLEVNIADVLESRDR